MLSRMEANELAKHMLKLNNGSQAPAMHVIVMLMTMKQLLTEHPETFYELVQKCRNTNHVMFEGTTETLRRFGIDANHIPQVTKNVVLSTVVGDGLLMRIVDPVRRSSVKDMINYLNFLAGNNPKLIAFLITATLLVTAYGIYDEYHEKNIRQAAGKMKNAFLLIWKSKPDDKRDKSIDNDFNADLSPRV